MSPDPSTTEESRRVIEAMYAAAISGDMVAFDQVIDDDAQFHEPDCLPYGGSYRGKAALVELFQRVAKYLDFPTIKLHYILAEGEHVISSLELTGQNGRLLKLLEEAVIHNGKVVDLRIYLFDPSLVTMK